jgi:hypothetical protein
MVTLLDVHALSVDVSPQAQCNRTRMHFVRPDLFSTQPICAVKSLDRVHLIDRHGILRSYFIVYY